MSQDVEKQKATIYATDSIFGNLFALEGYLVEHGSKHPRHSYRDVAFAHLIPKGKRLAREVLASSRGILVIIEGWGHPNASTGIDKIVAAIPPSSIVADYRQAGKRRKASKKGSEGAD